MFQFPRCPPVALSIQAPVRMPHACVGCPIRNRAAHRSLAAPRPRFAALRVLLRPLAPRHPPRTPPRLAYALGSLRWLKSQEWFDCRSAVVSILSFASAKLKQTHYVVVKVLTAVRLDN